VLSIAHERSNEHKWTDGKKRIKDRLNSVAEVLETIAEAVAVQKQANDIIEPLLMSHGLAASKQILYWQGIIDHPTCAFPRAGLTDAQLRRLRDKLASTAIAHTLVR
jgi:dihydrodipicolinate synthase/N-acetylneuraminate lyase